MTERYLDNLRSTVRLTASVRWIGVAFGLMMAFAFAPISRPAALAVTVVMSLYNAATWPLAGYIRGPRLALLAGILLGLDFLAVTTWVYLLANDQYSTSYVVYALVGIEASVLFLLAGTAAFAAAFVVAFMLLQPIRLHYFGFPLEWNSVAFRMGVVLLLVLFAGLIVRQSDRRRRQAEADAGRLRALSELSMRVGRVLSSKDLARAVVVELGRLYPGAWNAVLLRTGDLLPVVAASDDSASDIVPSDALKAVLESGPWLDLSRHPLGADHRGVRSGFAAPVRGASGVVGLIVSASAEPGHFSEQDRDLIVAIGAQFAVFQENAWLHETVQRMAELDPLTGLPNRRKFDGRLDAEVLRHQRSGAPLSLAYVDIDHFKDFNDRHGHLAGDRLLVQFATVVEGDRRATDTFYRIGGEEFALLLPDTDHPGARQVAERLCHAVDSAEFKIDKDAPPHHVSVSVGCVTSTGGVSDWAHELTKAADDALYEAKRAGRNRVEQADNIAG